MLKYVLLGIFISGLISTASGEEEGSDQDRIAALEQQVKALAGEINAQRDLDAAEVYNPLGKLRLGGYGDIHANFEENGKSVFDIHRLVMYVGYDFADWIVLNSEIELEHAYVTDGAGGEISIEQLYVDFLFAEAFNARAGRMLAPMGIINQYHEPTLFLGVERPSVDKYIIPSTWSIDGIGIFGSPLGWLSYQAYAVGGLDGSEFSADKGVRDGRIKERGGLNDPAVTGRIDLYPFEEQELRIGVSGYYGGTDNANKGGGNGTENNFGMYSADFEYEISRFRFRGVVAYGENSNPENLPLTGSATNELSEALFGWYIEGGISVMPNSWKKGKMAEVDLIPFVRYEEYDTQYKAAGSFENGANERTEITVGINVPLTYQFVVKADYQLKYSEAASNPNNVFNLGMG
ncbi:MAG: hypothetical protein KAH99_05415, partial [Verrucomicrobia bacterium]|nr:hypothetical protein [Verrucomicrobiota bacterium]